MAIVPVTDGSVTQVTGMIPETDLVPFLIAGSTKGRFTPRVFVESFQPAAFHYAFDTDIAASDPTNGFVKFDDAIPANITQIFISNVSDESFSLGTLWPDLEFGDILVFKQQSEKARGLLFSIDGPPVDIASLWASLPVTRISSGALPIDGSILEIGIISLNRRSRNFKSTSLASSGPGITINSNCFEQVNFNVTLTGGGTRELANPTNFKVSDEITYNLTQSTGAEAITFGSFFEFPDKIPPSLSGTAGALDILSCKVRTTSKITVVKLNNVGV